jgi:hypothetical protein
MNEPTNIIAGKGVNALITTAESRFDQHYETENRMVWNDEKHTYEEYEFIYEVSWIPELGAWRRFLRTHQRA